MNEDVCGYYLFNKLWVIDCLIPIYQPPDRMILNHWQPLLIIYLAWLNPRTQLIHSVIDGVLKCTAPYCKFENTLYPYITWLEKTSAVCWDIVNSGSLDRYCTSSHGILLTDGLTSNQSAKYRSDCDPACGLQSMVQGCAGHNSL